MLQCIHDSVCKCSAWTSAEAVASFLAALLSSCKTSRASSGAASTRARMAATRQTQKSRETKQLPIMVNVHVHVNSGMHCMLILACTACGLCELQSTIRGSVVKRYFVMSEAVHCAAV